MLRFKKGLLIAENKQAVTDYFWVEDVSEDKLEIIIDTNYWDYSGINVSIGIHNKDPASELEYNFKLREILTTDIFKDNENQKYDWYNQAYDSQDAGKTSSMARANGCEFEASIEFTYGEVVYPSFVPYLHLAKPQAGEVFWDIGCGAAKPLAIAAL